MQFSCYSALKASFEILQFYPQGQAEGKVYVDDYHSYAYRKGNFAITKLSFHNFKLESK